MRGPKEGHPGDSMVLLSPRELRSVVIIMYPPEVTIVRSSSPLLQHRCGAWNEQSVSFLMGNFKMQS